MQNFSASLKTISSLILLREFLEGKMQTNKHKILSAGISDNSCDWLKKCLTHRQ